ncbi:PREDICTED: uncharacterized protein LOC109229820 [Nicotiana attenuata]|uniref:uncharacterized protein LOC109229820 n=1 Tax=Nicotiana attenuata TaxID=49451 RepID=UPI0009053309|nr:PREDICTED: uncharacterized protein LOC109229820 [Nicotiana attenuata]
MISQQKYIKELLKRFETESSKTIDTSIATATRLDMDEPSSPMNEKMYGGIIGSLLYLTATRPDIIFSMGLYARFSIQSKGISFESCQKDSMVSQRNVGPDRKSISGMAHFLGSCLISWGTKKQNFVALSTQKLSKQAWQPQSKQAANNIASCGEGSVVPAPSLNLNIATPTANVLYASSDSVLEVNEKEAIENMLLIAAEGGLVDVYEGDNETIGSQGKMKVTKLRVGNWCTMENLAPVSTTRETIEGPDPSAQQEHAAPTWDETPCSS